MCCQKMLEKNENDSCLAMLKNMLHVLLKYNVFGMCLRYYVFLHARKCKTDRIIFAFSRKLLNQT